MEKVQEFETGHKDVIHDIAYDFYGDRLATASSDRRIKVFRKDTGKGWELDSKWDAHNGSIQSISWAHPEYGRLIASGSYDGTVAIWQQKGRDPETRLLKYNLEAELTHFKGPVTRCLFAPHHTGLKLGVISEDGKVYVFEAQNALNVKEWTLLFEYDCHIGALYSFCWNPAPYGPLSFVIGAADKRPKVFTTKADSDEVFLYAGELPTMIEAVSDVTWAPNLGRSYDLIAISYPEQAKVCIFSFSDVLKVGNSEVSTLTTSRDQKLWRLAWNVTGTTLAASDDNGTVYLFQSKYKKQWAHVPL